MTGQVTDQTRVFRDILGQNLVPGRTRPSETLTHGLSYRGVTRLQGTHSARSWQCTRSAAAEGMAGPGAGGFGPTTLRPMTAAEAASYEQLFAEQGVLQSGCITGTQLRPVLLQSGLPTSDLKEIWDLADPVKTRLTACKRTPRLDRCSRCTSTL